MIRVIFRFDDVRPRPQLSKVVSAERATQAKIMRFPLKADVPVIIGRGSIKDPDHPKTLASRSKLAEAYRVSGRAAKAIRRND